MLKLTKLFLALTLVAFMSACSSDDDAGSDELVGTWKVVSFTLNTETSVVASGNTTESIVSATGSNFDYSLVFTDDAFTTSGGYEIETSGSVAGQSIDATSSTYTDVDGSGTYSTSGNEMTINGSFFSFDFNGTPYTGANGPQTINYEINSNNQLVFTQNETQTTDASGVMSTSSVVSNSTWEKQ